MYSQDTSRLFPAATDSIQYIVDKFFFEDINGLLEWDIFYFLFVNVEVGYTFNPDLNISNSKFAE